MRIVAALLVIFMFNNSQATISSDLTASDFGIWALSADGITNGKPITVPPLGGLRFRSADDGSPSFGAEGEPFAFEVGTGGVTRGFDEGAADMRRGEKRILILPASLAYGRSGHYATDVPGQTRFHISPNTMLVYEVERLDR